MICPDWHDFMRQPGLLYGLTHRLLADRFNGRDLAPGHSADRQHARTHGLAIQVHGANAALGDAAAVLGARQAHHVAQDPQQWHVFGDIQVVLLAVNHQFLHRNLRRSSRLTHSSTSSVVERHQGFGLF
jgi:hypothetical protein